MTTEYGSVREVWFADVATPTARDSFLIRDDSYVVTGQTFGRTVRLGDPIDTGADSGWKQVTWEGGQGQNLWSDAQMYKSGSVDSSTAAGRLRLWPGSTTVAAHPSRRFEGFIVCPGASGDGVTNPLWFGETAMHLGKFGNPTTPATNPGGGWALNRYDPSNNTFRTVKFFDSPIMSMAPLMSDDGSSEWMHVVEQAGKYWMVKDDGSQAVQDTNAIVYGYQSHSLVAFGGAMYFCQGNWLGKRVAIAPYGVLGTHSKVKELRGARWTRGLAVWQNRLWFCAQYGGGKAVLYTSDGVSANEAAQWEDQFVPQNVISHFGALYIAGYKPSGKWDNGTIAQVWKYTGSSMVKLWEHGNGRDGKTHMASGLATLGNNLVWTQDGFDSNEDEEQPWPDRRPGLMMYDAYKDALFEGPSFDMDAVNTEGIRMTDVCAYNNSLVWSGWDEHNYGGVLTFPTFVGMVRGYNEVLQDMTGGTQAAAFGSKSFAAQPATRTQKLLSAEYSGPSDVADAAKCWLAVRARTRISGSGGGVEIKVSFNDDPTEYSVLTVSYDGSRTDWVLQEGAILVGSPADYPIGSSINYHVYLTSTSDSAQAEVDAVSVRYALLPDKQRSWRMRAICSDAQTRLDGSANPLATGADLEAALEQYWSYRRPFLMWGPFSYPAVDPDDLNDSTKTEVRAQEFALNEYREDSTASTLQREVTLSLIEVTPSQVWA